MGRTADMGILSFDQKNPQFLFEMAEILHVYSKAPKVGYQYVFKAFVQKIYLIGV